MNKWMIVILIVAVTCTSSVIAQDPAAALQGAATMFTGEAKTFFEECSKCSKYGIRDVIN